MKYLRRILKRLRYMKSNPDKKTTWRLAEHFFRVTFHQL